jgi:hypothetical protein
MLMKSAGSAGPAKSHACSRVFQLIASNFSPKLARVGSIRIRGHHRPINGIFDLSTIFLSPFPAGSSNTLAMKITSFLACLILGCFTLSATATTMTITSNPGTDVTVKFILGASNIDAGPVTSSFTFTTAKGLLGPSSNPTDQSGFANSGKDLFAITVEPATKAAFVHLFLVQTKGTLIFLNDVNRSVANLLPQPWKSDAKEFLRVERIHGRKIRLETIDFSHAPFKTRSFWVLVDSHGAITLVP